MFGYTNIVILCDIKKKTQYCIDGAVLHESYILTCNLKCINQEAANWPPWDGIIFWEAQSEINTVLTGPPRPSVLELPTSLFIPENMWITVSQP